MKFLAGLKSVLLLSRLYTQTSFLAIHCPYYRHKCRVHKGGTESDKSSFYVENTWEVGWRNLKNSPLVSDEKIFELGWCDWCLTAEKLVPVRSEEIWRIHLMLLIKKHQILELGWCDWCFTAEKSVPVRSEECICDGEFLPFTDFKTT